MKAILEFNLPEDLESHNMALNGVKYNGVIESVIDHIRQKLKYEDEHRQIYKPNH